MVGMIIKKVINVKMTSRKMKELIEKRLSRPEWSFLYDNKKDQLRIEETESKKGITISLPGIIAKWEEKKEKAIEEVVYNVEEALFAMLRTQNLKGKEASIFPVIRSTSFPEESSDGKKLIFEEHTAETRVFYALDLGNSYRLIDADFADKEGFDQDRMKEMAKFNLRSLDTKLKKETVAGNDFIFIHSNDGYDASRILNESLLDSLKKEIKGEMAVAVPHQDVLIIADIKNEQGYDILAQMTMSFFADGRVPITALPFLYENKELEPIFILAHIKPKN
jgi:uncharacterized protein YtpQ (UPF0354 family)